MNDCNIDIICITESWLSEEFAHTEAVLKSYGFQLSHTYRPNRAGGGVAFLLKKGLEFKEVTIHLQVNSFEWHAVRIVGYGYLIATVYRIQEINMNTFIEEFSNFMSVI